MQAVCWERAFAQELINATQKSSKKRMLRVSYSPKIKKNVVKKLAQK